jgi:hypothetical protein
MSAETVRMSLHAHEHDSFKNRFVDCVDCVVGRVICIVAASEIWSLTVPLETTVFFGNSVCRVVVCSFVTSSLLFYLIFYFLNTLV